jgi:hypothetical protein
MASPKLAPACSPAVMIASILAATTSQAPVLSPLEMALSSPSSDQRSVSPRSLAMLMQDNFTSALMVSPTALSSAAAWANALTFTSTLRLATASPPAANSSQPLSASCTSFLRAQSVIAEAPPRITIQGNTPISFLRMGSTFLVLGASKGLDVARF